MKRDGIKSMVFLLSGKTIDEISDYARKYFTDSGMGKRTVQRYRLAIEELFLQWTDRYGEGVGVKIVTGRRFTSRYLSIMIEGEPFDPFREEKEEIGIFGSGNLRMLGLSPDYLYLDGENCFRFDVKKQRKNPLFKLLAAACVSLLVGAIGLMLPEAVRLVMLNDLITPVHDAFLNLLGCAAGPMMFLSVTWGIYGIGDTTTLSKIGKRMILYFIGVLFLILVCSCIMLIPAFDIRLTGGFNNTYSLSSIVSLLLDIIPSNVFSPFVEGNSLQIIFLAFVVGLAMLFLGKKTALVAEAIEQVNFLVQFLMGFISWLVPFFIALVTLQFVYMVRYYRAICRSAEAYCRIFCGGASDGRYRGACYGDKK